MGAAGHAEEPGQAAREDCGRAKVRPEPLAEADRWRVDFSHHRSVCEGQWEGQAATVPRFFRRHDVVRLLRGEPGDRWTALNGTVHAASTA